MLTILPRVVNQCWARNPFSFQHKCFWCPFLRATPNHLPLKYRCLFKIMHQIRHIHLIYENPMEWMNGLQLFQRDITYALCHVPWVGRPSHVAPQPFTCGHISFILDVKIASYCLQYVQWVDIFLIERLDAHLFELGNVNNVTPKCLHIPSYYRLCTSISRLFDFKLTSEVMNQSRETHLKWINRNLWGQVTHWPLYLDSCGRDPTQRVGV